MNNLLTSLFVFFTLNLFANSDSLTFQKLKDLEIQRKIIFSETSVNFALKNKDNYTKIEFYNSRKSEKLNTELKNFKNINEVSIFYYNNSNFCLDLSIFKKLKIISIYKSPNLNLDSLFSSLNKDSIISIRINESSVTNLPTSIQRFENLRCIDLSHNFINEIPDSITNLSKIQTLNLSNNPLTFTDPVFLSKLLEIRKLELNNTFIFCNYSFEYFYEAIKNFSNLKEIGLESTCLSRFPYELSNLKNIEIIGIGQNPISEIYDIQMDFPKLKILFVNNIKARHIPKCFDKIQVFQN